MTGKRAILRLTKGVMNLPKAFSIVLKFFIIVKLNQKYRCSGSAKPSLEM